MSDKTIERRNAALESLDIEEIKTFLSYDPKSGSFTWLKDTGKKKITGKKAGFVSLGYVRIGIFGRKITAGVLAWMIITGEVPEGIVDHRNGDPLDNRWLNLRLANRVENNRNCKTRKTSVLGIKGVQRRKSGKFSAKIHIAGKQTYLGVFDTAEDASAAYEKAAKLHHGEFMRNS